MSGPADHQGEALDAAGLIAALTPLLEAERAGVRVGARLAAQAPDPPARALAQTIRQDEARWCQLLDRALRDLGAEPSTKVGDFYGKVMAIEGFEARLAFLNRGQAWVVRRLQDLLPRIRDDRLAADLRAMLEAHVANIELTDAALAGGASPHAGPRPAPRPPGGLP